MGHPIEVMDLSFALQALCAQYIAKNGKKLKGGVYEVPQEIDEKIAHMKLTSLGLTIDEMTKEQKRYLARTGISARRFWSTIFFENFFLVFGSWTK